MFAYVKFLDTKQDNLYKVPCKLIKDFFPKSREDFVKAPNVYKVFWCPDLEKAQDDSSRLKSVRVPPKCSWQRQLGTKFYDAYILRLADTLEELVASIKKKRPNIPTTRYPQGEETSTGTEDDPHPKSMNNKVQEIEVDEDKVNEAIKGRKDMFSQNGAEDSDDESFDDGIISNYTDTQTVGNLKQKISELEKEITTLKVENGEVHQLRALNRELQKQLIDLVAKGACSDESNNSEREEREELTEDVDLGNGVVLKRSVFNLIKEEVTLSKFTKSLSVAIWGSEILKNRSTTGIKCRNIRGCKKRLEGGGEEEKEVLAKQALSPEKLIVISAQMREYMERRKFDVNVIEANMKRRNKFIGEKIMDLNKKRKLS